MSNEILSLIEHWSGSSVVVRHDGPTGTWLFIALHSSALGRPTGGTRIKVYPALADGLRDAMRLAEGMTSKWAALGMAYGGGKAVLALPHRLGDEEREGLLRRYGRLVESLSGAFATGADLGAGPETMATIARETRFVLGIDYADGSSVDPGPFTARGVLRGIESALEQVFGSADPRGRRILVEGTGGVGRPLARELAERGAELALNDIDRERVEALAGELGARVVDSADVFPTACDVYAPCAVGGTLNARSIPALGCRIVAGSANNQLLVDEDAARLHERGILYVPDYIINAGGAMAFALMADGLKDRGELEKRVDGIGATVREILAEAGASHDSPVEAARRRVEQRLASAS